MLKSRGGNLVALIKGFFDEIIFNIISRDQKVAMPRVYVVLVFFLLCYVVISLRLFNVTVMDKLFESTEGQHGNQYHRASNVAKRSDIIDRNGELLAINLVTTSIYANPKFITDPVNTAKKLQQIFPSLNRKDILNKLKSDKSFVWIKRNVIPKEEQRVYDLGIPGLYFETSEKRAYPHSSLFSHVVGYVGLDGQGLSGIERYFDQDLRSKSSEDAIPLQLSLDVKAQGIIKNELEKAIKEFSAVGGIGILQDVNNGEILAMVNLPDYDPHNLNKASEDALFNKITLGNYEAGSTFKIFTMAAALDTKTIRLNDVYDVDTPLYLSGYQIKDLHAKGGWLSVPQILMYSSNVGISQIALELGKEKQFSYLKALGFLSPLSIELHEKSTPSYNSFAKWDDLTVVTSSYGYGISVSPLHIVKGMGAVVNGGKLYSPTLIKGRHAEYKQVLKKSTSKDMRKLLRMVVRFGTGRKSEVEGVFIGGKTSSVHKVIDGKYQQKLKISSFVSVFPVHDPKYVMLIAIDEPHGNKDSFGFATGGWVAAPATARIVEKLTPVLGIVPENNQKEVIEKSLFVEYNSKSELS
jgi:cell division protein FtsI (penicillin-binding protein 3)